MRLDARRGPWRFTVWHCDEHRALQFVVWIDVDKAEYGEDIDPLGAGNIVTRQAKAIRVLSRRRLILINPIRPEDETTPATGEQNTKENER